MNVLGKRELPRLDREVPGLAYRIPTPGLKAVDGQVHCSLQIPGFALRYTTDGGEPSVRTPEVRGPIPLAPVVRVAAFDRTGRKGHTATLRTPARSGSRPGRRARERSGCPGPRPEGQGVCPVRLRRRRASTIRVTAT